MSNIFFISDLHLGHKGILNWTKHYRQGSNIDEHDEWIVNRWNATVGKNDKVFVGGDVCFDLKKLGLFGQMRGKKHLILGNHDVFKILEYLKYFDNVSGPIKYKDYWVTHIPMHPQELWGKKNIHGHTHKTFIRDERYINICVETCFGSPIPFDNIVDGSHKRFYEDFIDNLEGACGTRQL